MFGHTRLFIRSLGRDAAQPYDWLDQALEGNVASELRESHEGAVDVRLRVKQCSKSNRGERSD